MACLKPLAALTLALIAPVTAQAATERAPPPAGMVDQPCPANRDGLWALDPYVLKYDWAWLCRYQADNAALIAAKTQPRAVFIGDSITEGWIAQDAAFFAHGFADRGISGQTSQQALLRFYQDVIQLRPKVVHIMIGTNDIAGNLGPTSPEDYRNSIRAMVDLARTHGIAVVLGSILPTDHFGWATALRPAARVRELNRWLREYAQTEGLGFADYYSAMAGPNGELLPALSGDGVHPNAAGFAIMKPIAERAIAEAERKAKQRR